MPDQTQDTTEPWERWNLKPYVPDNRTTEDHITELMTNLPKPEGISDTIGIRSCAFKRRGAYKKMTRCDRRAAVGSTLCNVHRRLLFE